ncbi:hypothetical protein WJX74_007165 [Apatococcus lobatus]|uniref:Photosystem II reaction center X protein n=2 Tax=Apatococcus TaxID=904362 RepID=A0AAW1T7F7_9CHLO
MHQQRRKYWEWLVQSGLILQWKRSMAAAMTSASISCSSKVGASQKAFSGLPVARRSGRVACRVQRQTVASSQQKQQASRTEVASAIISTSTAAMLASPIAAEAAVTPSLKNLLFSVTAGGVILVVIVAAITFVSNFDPVARR